MSDPTISRLFRIGFWLACAVAVLIPGFLHAEDAASDETPVSFYRDVRPILQRNCSGCHQPAKAGGNLVLTSFGTLKQGGENGSGFEPGKPDESTLVEFITGPKPLMPLKADPLSEQQVALITRWVAEGANDDTPMGVQDDISADSPPTYTRPPVISALAYSPDGKWLVVSGYREVLVHNADGSGLAHRLVGQSQRIESIDFSKDGKLIGTAGGNPSLFGEVQFWSTDSMTDPNSEGPGKFKLVRSGTYAADCLFGGRFSDDGKYFSFGAADNSIRVIQVADAQLLRKMDPHSDWVFGTAFSLDGSHVVSVSRDMAMKLSILENGQFVDNITSITPGALKGGLMAVRRHPLKDEFLTGGADGEPKLYQMLRTQARKIGDDANRIRGYPAMPGRIFSLDFSGDGSKFVAGSSTGTDGTVRIYKTDDGALLHELKGHPQGIFAVAFRPDGTHVATGGFDGQVRLFDVESGELVKQFVPVEVSPAVAESR